MTSRERRKDARFEIARPIKIRCEATGKYYAGKTCNVSASGAMIEVEHPSLMVPGQQLRIGVAWTQQQAVLQSEQMYDATVIRSLAIEGCQNVAIQFLQRQQNLAATA